MAARGLGKGLDALIPNSFGNDTGKKSELNAKKENRGENIENKEGETLVNITKVEPNREQPRKNFDEDSLEELAESIKQFGLLQPILVQDRKDYYEIIAGERRWRAAKLAGLKEGLTAALEMDSNRVAIAGNNFRTSAFSDEYDLNNPEYATPLGIAISSGLNMINDSFRVTLNEKSAKLFRSGSLRDESSDDERLRLSGYAGTFRSKRERQGER